MISDAMCEEEMYQAYLLYASLHGLCTEEDEVRSRIQSYRENQPDETIDLAILAYSEDRIVAPPDIVLERWGKSRVYELEDLPDGDCRHQVCESWFENGCSFEGEGRPASLCHFWTTFSLIAPQSADEASSADDASSATASLHQLALGVGSRVQFRILAGEVQISHRRHGILGVLPQTLANEMIERATREDMRYLPLVDTYPSDSGSGECKLLVTVADPCQDLTTIVAYAASAFSARKQKC